MTTRDRGRHQTPATELGATRTGVAGEEPPARLGAAVIFAPAGELAPVAPSATGKGGVLVLGGRHMSAIPSFEYALLYGGRVARSVADNTRGDGRELLAETARVPVRTHVETFPLARANEALVALKHDPVRGAAVLLIEHDH